MVCHVAVCGKGDNGVGREGWPDTVRSRRGEPDAHLQKALAFFRSVGATGYVREGEALLAASA
jgi:hypothetical protein